MPIQNRDSGDMFINEMVAISLGTGGVLVSYIANQEDGGTISAWAEGDCGMFYTMILTSTYYQEVKQTPGHRIVYKQ